MKRTLLQRGAIIAACAAAFVFAACGDNPEFDARTDTVYSLETPQVTAKAYPGVNVVSWKPVTGAEGYKVSVYEEGLYKGPLTNQSGNSGYDTNLKNGKTYTYYVEALSKSSPSSTVREVVATNSRGEASVKAIVPPLDTKALDLAAYEGGYDGKNVKTVSENDQGVVNSKNINAVAENGKVYVDFPMKAYLKYTVKYYNNDLLPLEINEGVKVGTKQDLYANNALGQVSFNISNPGKYKIVVEVSPYDDTTNYTTSSEVVREKLVDIEKLNIGKQTGNVWAEYILTENKFVTGAKNDVRVWFEPATMKNGELVNTSWYTVYRRAVGEYENTPLDAKAVKKGIDENGGTYYYAYDTVPDATKDYVYTIVVSHEEKYGDAKTQTLHALSKPNITGLLAYVSQDPNDDNKVVLTVETANNSPAEKVTPTSATYLVVPTNRVTPVLAQEIIENGKTATLLLVADSDPKTYKAGLTDLVPKDSTAYVYMVVEATLDGYNTETVVASSLISR